MKSVERIHYRDRQRLDAADLQKDAAYEAQMRALHLIALHNVWGIAVGMEVEPVGDAVRISAGLAYDCYGREVWLARPLNVPPPDTEAVLVVRYVEAQANCAVSGLSWRWSAPEAVCLGVEIPLARMTVGGDLDLSARCYVRKLAPAQVYSTQVELDSAALKGTLFSWSVTVDTSAAHFSTVPAYTAQFVDPSSLQHRLAELLKDAGVGTLVSGLVGPFLAITAVLADSFTLEVHWGMAFPAGADIQRQVRLAKLAQTPASIQFESLSMTLYWMGIA